MLPHGTFRYKFAASPRSKRRGVDVLEQCVDTKVIRNHTIYTIIIK